MSHRKPPPLVASGVVEAPVAGKAPKAPAETPTISHHSDDPLSINHDNSCRGQLTIPLDLGLLGIYALRSPSGARASPRRATTPLYTAEERRRRDASPWTIVQAALAPIQFAIFLVSLCLVIRYLASSEGLAVATASIVVKTITLYVIMITGSIWEREVFGRYLFARPFFWEDVFGILVLALHTIYLVALVTGTFSPRNLMLVALAAYAAYVINAAQFVLKLRAARRQRPLEAVGSMGLAS
jgi:3-vinyl bacteriochlorophyllide hydratase